MRGCVEEVKAFSSCADRLDARVTAQWGIKMCVISCAGSVVRALLKGVGKGGWSQVLDARAEFRGINPFSFGFDSGWFLL